MLQQIGKYEIIEQIGRGGQGTVYRARDTDLDRIVAIKVIDQSVVDDPNSFLLTQGSFRSRDRGLVISMNKLVKASIGRTYKKERNIISLRRF